MDKTLWLQFDWRRRSSSACRSPLLRDQTRGLVMAEWTLSNLGQLLHLMIKKGGLLRCEFITGLKLMSCSSYRDIRKNWQCDRHAVITSQVLMFGGAISSYLISVGHYRRDCGTESIIKAALRHFPFVFIFLGNSMQAGVWVVCVGFLVVCFCCVMYENCWLNLLVETVGQFRTFVSSLKMEKKNGSIVRSVIFAGEKCFGGQKRASHTKVQSGLNRSGLVHLLLAWLDHPDWSGLTSEHCIPLGKKRSCRRTAFQIHFLPATKRLNNKKLNSALRYPVASNVKWSWLLIMK